GEERGRIAPPGRKGAAEPEGAKAGTDADDVVGLSRERARLYLETRARALPPAAVVGKEHAGTPAPPLEEDHLGAVLGQHHTLLRAVLEPGALGEHPGAQQRKLGAARALSLAV